MNKLQALLVASVFSTLSVQVYAEPVDSGPPAQQQKDAVPNSTENGNFLEKQPGEINDAGKPSDKHHDNATNTNKNKSKPKGKNVTNKPKDGGVDVSPQ